MATIQHVLTADASQLLRTYDEVHGALGEHQTDLGKNVKASELAAGAAAAVAAALVTTAAAAVKATRATVELAAGANQYAKAAKQFGESAEEVQKVDGALGLLTDGSASAIDAMEKLSRNLAEARDGAGPAADALGKLGLRAEDLAALPLSERLVAIANNFDRLEDSADETQVAMDLLGRSGAALVPAFRSGGDAIRQAIGQIEDAGVVSNDTAAQSEGLTDAVDLMHRSFASLKRDALAPLIPVIAAAADGISDTIQLLRQSEVVTGFANSIANLAVRVLGLTDEVEAFKKATRDAQEQSKSLTQRYNEAADAASAQAAEVDRLNGEIERLSRVGFDTTKQQEDLAAATERLKFLNADAASSQRLLAIEMEAAAAAEEAAASETRRRERAQKSQALLLKASTEIEDEHTQSVKDAAEAEKQRREELENVQSAMTMLVERGEDLAADRAGQEARIRLESKRTADAIQANLAEILDSTEATEADRERAQRTAAQALVDLEAKTQERIQGLRRETVDAEIRSTEELLGVREQAAIDYAQIEQGAAQTTIDIVSDLTSTLISRAQELNAERTKDARKRRDRELGLAILLGELQAAAAFGSTLAQIGGTPVGYAAAAAAATAVGVASKAAAAVAYDRSSNYYHDGGLVDEIDIRARAGESVLTPPATRSLGVDTIDRLNSSSAGTMAQSITVVQKLDHRVVDQQHHRALQRYGSPIATAVRATNPRGTARRNPYLGK